MKSFSAFILLIFTIATYSGYGQQNDNSSDQSVKFHFDQKDFGDRFCVAADNDADYNYYVINMEKFAGRYEKIYFLNLVFTNDKIVNIDAEIDNTQLWFKSSIQNPENDITCLMDDLKKQTDQAASKLSGAEKTAWLKTNDKYAKKQ
jgi:hypothetical protein